MKIKKTVLNALKKSLITTMIVFGIGCLLYVGVNSMCSDFNALCQWQVYVGGFILVFAFSLLYFCLPLLLKMLDSVD